jgi:monofunctional biosynthetic peptidoglycan transglycosylase
MAANRQRPKKKRFPKKNKSRVRRLTAGIFKILLGLVFLSFLLVLILRWINPPTSMMMTIRRSEAAMNHRKDFRIDYRWVNWDQIALHLPLAIIASEDQNFPIHHGFDLEAISDAVKTRMNGGRLRGASTITQQVAKNLFLWPGKSLLRKGIEAYFTALIEIFWNKQRILEVYMNIAEFGDGIFGAEAACQRYFRKPAGNIRLREAARLAAVLPYPKAMDPKRPSAYVSKRAQWIQRQIVQMGGKRVLEKINS